MSSKIINRTPIDNLGEKVGLYREREESIEDFQNRVYETLKSLDKHKYSFRDSLDYLTSDRCVNLFKINPPTGSFPEVKWDGVFLEIDNEKFHESDIKFARDFQSKLEERGLTCDYLGEEVDLKFLKSKNILPFETKRHKLNQQKNQSEITELNEKNITDLYDSNATYTPDSGNPEAPDTSDNLEEWKIVNGDVLHTENKEADLISYNYSDYPLVIRWSVFRYYVLNDAHFDYRIKSLEQVVPNEDPQPYLLTQEGAKLLNKLYQISNTYWGE